MRFSTMGIKPMRLDGRKAVMEYLNRNPLNNQAWIRVKRRFGEVIRRDIETGRVWTMSEWLDGAMIKTSRAIQEKAGVSSP